MGNEPVQILLERKLELLNSVFTAASAVNAALLKKDFPAALKKDEEKASFIEKLKGVDKEIAGLRVNGAIKAGETIIKINSVLENLIKVEKENEVLATRSAGFFSQARVDLYKKNAG